MKLKSAALMLAACVVMMIPSASFANGTEKCPAGDEKIESGPWEYCKKGEVVKSICIKAGNRTYSFDSDGTDKCYTVKGLGTDCVIVTGGGTGRDCKEISGVTFFFDKK